MPFSAIAVRVDDADDRIWPHALQRRPRAICRSVVDHNDLPRRRQIDVEEAVDDRSHSCGLVEYGNDDGNELGLSTHRLTGYRRTRIPNPQMNAEEHRSRYDSQTRQTIRRITHHKTLVTGFGPGSPLPELWQRRLLRSSRPSAALSTYRRQRR